MIGMKDNLENALWSLARKSERGGFSLTETADGLRSRSFSWVGWVMSAAGAALLTYVLTQAPAGAGKRWVPLVVGAAFVLTGTVFALSRHVLEINWSDRSWREQHQFLFWTTRAKQGTFDDFRGVVLSRFRRPLLTVPSCFWLVSLDFQDSPAFYDLFWSYNEQKARDRFQHLARKLGLPSIDRTREQPE